MKKLLSLLLLSTGLSSSLCAQNDDTDVFYDAEEDIFYDAEEELMPLTLKTSDGREITKVYLREELEKFTLFKHLFEDLEDSNEIISLDIKESLPTHFAELVALANGQQTELSNAMLSDARENPEYLKHLFLLAMHVDPINKKVLYPITLALLNNPSMMQPTGPTDDLTIALLDNFVELLNEQPNELSIMLFDENAYEIIQTQLKPMNNIKNIVRTILATPYLRDTLTNRQARLLISGIKKQAVAMYSDPKLYQRVDNYLDDHYEPRDYYKVRKEFPVVPGTLPGSRPRPGQFPISTQDIVDYMGVTVELKQGILTCDLSYNHITTIDPTTFKGMPNFTSLNLDHNNINSLQQTDFQYVPQITSLDLGDNDLTELPANVFIYVPMLESLYLSGNAVFPAIQPNAFTYFPMGLTTIQPGAFNGLTKLTFINLRHNKLTILLAGTFANLPLLESLDISYNQITSIEAGTFVNVPTLESLTLVENPLQETKEQIRSSNPALPNNCGIYLTLEELNQLDNDEEDDDEDNNDDIQDDIAQEAADEDDN